MTSLTDRYIWAATRTVPELQRSDVEPEIREMVEDSVRARVASGEEWRTAERAALVELGDPERLAADYVDRPLTLIGPRYYLDWLRLLKTLAFIIVPIASAATFLVRLLVTGEFGDAVGGAVSTAINVAVHIGFWTTLVFVILERSDGTVASTAKWTPDRLQDLPDRSRQARLPEFVASVVFLTLFAGAIVWQHLFSVVRDAGGNPIPFLEPELWSFWIPWFLGVLLAEMLFAAWLYLRGWSGRIAFVNLALNLAFTVPAVILWSQGRLLNQAFLDAAGWSPAATGASRIVSAIVIGVVVTIAVWDVVDGFLKARRESSAPGLQRPEQH